MYIFTKAYRSGGPFTPARNDQDRSVYSGARGLYGGYDISRNICHGCAANQMVPTGLYTLLKE
jgi:hypothetical protein